MSKECDADGFQVVRRRRRGYQAPPRTPHPISREKYCGPNPTQLCSRITTDREEMQRSQFYQDLSVLMMRALGGKYHFKEVVCYGIGHIGLCAIARQQFALLLTLSQQWKPKTVWVYDPQLYEEELRTIQQLGCQIIPQNEMCRRSVVAPTLFYMPHCGKAMYNNLLWANWEMERLSLVCIIGNSFSSYSNRLPAKQLQKETPFIYNILDHCLEIPFPQSFHDPNVFNDTALHTFPLHQLQTLPTHIWDKCTEPEIDLSDPEIIV